MSEGPNAAWGERMPAVGQVAERSREVSASDIDHQDCRGQSQRRLAILNRNRISYGKPFDDLGKEGFDHCFPL